VSDLREKKAELRRLLRDRRDRLAAADAMAASHAAAPRAVQAVQAGPAHVVAAFFSLPGEIDTQPLITALLEAGSEILLPRMVGKVMPLAFHTWRPGEPLEPASMGVRQPLADSPRREPTRIIVPLLAFDHRGYRLGYGGGFYDRTLAALRSEQGSDLLAVGYGFDLQEVPEVPYGPLDVPVDLVVTESRTITPQPEG
jgi:5-formyltetrahydrofolate cyclo-ligase